MAEPGVYAQCGLRLRSAIELALPRVGGERWDVDVRWGSALEDSTVAPPGDEIAAYDAGGTRWYTATATGSGFVVRFRECGDFVVSADLDEVLVRPDPTGRSDLLPILLAGTVCAFLLTLRGRTVLHASAVAVDGRVLAFVGQSGRGKSTLAALLCADGADLVTDDVLTVDAGPPATCTGGAAELRLRASAAGIARDRPGTVTRTTADDRLAYAPRTAILDPLPLAGIVIPAPSRTATDVVARRVPPSTALFGLLSFPRVHGWRRSDVLERDFATLGRLVDEVPVHAVTVPWGPPFDDAVGRSLRRLIDPPDGW